MRRLENWTAASIISLRLTTIITAWSGGARSGERQGNLAVQCTICAAGGEPPMPRAVGQIDRAKSEAMLNAAGQVIAERGLTAPVEAIAQRAGVSKQTLYNRYGGKAGLIRALIRRGVDTVTASLSDPVDAAAPEATLAAFAHDLMTAMLTPGNLALTRVAIQGAADMPDVAEAVYRLGAQTMHARLADFLRAETDAGRLAVDDPDEAAEFFAGMAGARQMHCILGVLEPVDAGTVEHLSRSIARRFVRAYAPPVRR
jgi:TetR/AcrR family transcriptional repressor of mexJK operon